LGDSQANTAEDEIEFQTVEPGHIAVVAVAAGRGMVKVLAELGVAAIVEGGQTNNPSTEEILKAIESLSTDQVIILPNNKNIILSAEQVIKLATDRHIRVIPTRTFPQGVSAMFAYEAAGDLDDVAAAMSDAKDHIVTAEVTYATRSVELDGVNVQEGQVIGLVNGQLKLAGDDLESVVSDALELAELDDKEIVTLYFGDQITEADAQLLADTLAEIYDALEFEVVHGGQAHYPYIVSIE
jgi:dihydroxyacetone kinase-like predicted kinase